MYNYSSIASGSDRVSPPTSTTSEATPGTSLSTEIIQPFETVLKICNGTRISYTPAPQAFAFTDICTLLTQLSPNITDFRITDHGEGASTLDIKIYLGEADKAAITITISQALVYSVKASNVLKADFSFATLMAVLEEAERFEPTILVAVHPVFGLGERVNAKFECEDLVLEMGLTRKLVNKLVKVRGERIEGVNTVMEYE